MISTAFVIAKNRIKRRDLLDPGNHIPQDLHIASTVIRSDPVACTQNHFRPAAFDRMDQLGALFPELMCMHVGQHHEPETVKSRRDPCAFEPVTLIGDPVSAGKLFQNFSDVQNGTKHSYLKRIIIHVSYFPDK